MPLSRQKFNNIIILFCLILISLLMLLEKGRQAVPSETQSLFNNEFSLSQLQVNKLWMKLEKHNFQCSKQVINCQQWITTWQNLQVSPLIDEPEIHSPSSLLTLQVTNVPAAQLWLLYPTQGLLKSSLNHWYHIPPSLRENLLPIESQ